MILRPGSPWWLVNFFVTREMTNLLAENIEKMVSKSEARHARDAAYALCIIYGMLERWVSVGFGRDLVLDLCAIQLSGEFR